MTLMEGQATVLVSRKSFFLWGLSSQRTRGGETIL